MVSGVLLLFRRLLQRYQKWILLPPGKVFVHLSLDNGDDPVGKFRISELIGICLKKTGLDENINVINNIRAGSGSLSITDASAIFYSPENIIAIGAAYVGYFYAGQRITITGTTSNNGTYTVRAVGTVPFFTYIYTFEDLTDESLTNVTFQDEATNGHFYDKCYLDARTFVDNGEYDDCYTVLEKILGHSCCLFQYKGEWWIVRIDEYESSTNPFFRFIFDSAHTPYILKRLHQGLMLDHPGYSRRYR